ncbi:sigma-70 family RNA polymerase sigma factor [Stieleria sp. ICT_E10.1]|uniref:sigma-70 family RNA polymerase sigma factor n=1 Tax=Stieleria sedimenti TaxID=2976331 RepID=UPI00217F8364|nr:sigma-70 family RNA polymerase sigma factor [Stieleria sedimenti]MCS7466566.1 sigma-70 family RNA polymerase sigma factor [Stieleria sedimenti]
MGNTVNITQILSKLGSGDSQAPSDLLPLVYDELRQLAATRMAGERPDHTLQATALVHEAYMRLVVPSDVQDWDSRGHFFSAAAKAMQRILVDHARSKAAAKRGGQAAHVGMTEFVEDSTKVTPEQILELDETLQKLEQEDPIVAELVRLRLYAGLSVTEAANVIGVSRTTAYEYWDFALAWYSVEISAS